MIQGGFREGLGWVRVDLLVSGGFGSIRLVPAFSMNVEMHHFDFGVKWGPTEVDYVLKELRMVIRVVIIISGTRHD